jgi:hypothetical protein
MVRPARHSMSFSPRGDPSLTGASINLQPARPGRPRHQNHDTPLRDRLTMRDSRHAFAVGFLLVDARHKVLTALMRKAHFCRYIQ